MPDRRVVAKEPVPLARRVGIAAAIVLVVGVCAAVGGSIWAGGLVESRLRRLAEGAGLTLQATSISVSPLGDLKIDGLRMVRPDGTDVVAARTIGASLPPWRVAAGSRRPETLEIDGLRVQVLLHDGKPEELLDLLRSAKAALKGRSSQDRDPNEPQRKGADTAITLRDGKVEVKLQGRFEDLLPGGLTVADIAVHLDVARGVGEASARVDGAVQSKLQARLAPDPAGGSAKVQGAFEPPLRLPIPTFDGLPRVVDGVVIERFAYDSQTGPALAGVRLLEGKETRVTVENAGLDAASGGLAAGPIQIEAVVIRELQTWASARAAGDGEAAPAGGGDGDNAEPDDAAGGKGASADDNAPSKPKTKGTKGAKAAAPWRPAPSKLPATIAAIRVGQTDAGSARLRIEGVRVPLPAELGVFLVGSAEVELGGDEPSTPEPTTAALPAPADKPGAAAKAQAKGVRRMQVRVEGPQIEVHWSRPTIVAMPGGEALWDAVEHARRKPTVTITEDEEDDDEIDRPDLAPEARRKSAPKPAAKRKGRKGPATAAAIAPLQELLGRLTSIDSVVASLIGKLNLLPGLQLSVEGAAIGLLEPAAASPCCGVRAGKVALTRRLEDGSRGLDGSVDLFGAGDAAEGHLRLALSVGSSGRFERAELEFSGGAVAMAARSVGAAIHVGADATLGGSLVLRTEGEGKRTLVEGSIDAKGVGIDWWRLAPKPVDGLSFSARVLLTADAAAKSLILNLDPITVGEATAKALIEATDIGPKANVHVRFELPKQDCGKLAKSLPASMLPTIGAIEASGEIAADVDVSIPLGNPYKGKLDANLTDETCVVSQFGTLDLSAIAGDFARPVNESGTLLEDQLIGPQSDAWVPLAQLPAWVPYAMMVTEDAAFYHHRGLRLGLLGRAVKMNLDYGRFVYGGSTLTQQLVKNLYLTRDKYLMRKFEELLIVWHMERTLAEDKVKTKDRILELYVNAVEFAPHLYGIQRAAKTYFDKDAKALTPLEAAFLAANKPHPRVGFRVFESKKWTDWWQERMVGVLRKMRDDGIISEQQFIAEAPYVPRFLGWPAPTVPTADSTGPVGVGGVEE